MTSTLKAAATIFTISLVPASSQTTFAHWDLIGNPAGQNINQLVPTTHCVSDATITTNGVGYSWQRDGSESTTANGYNCFGLFTDNLDTNRYVSVSITFGNDVDADLASLNFDALNYGSQQAPNQIGVELFKNGVLVSTQLSVISDLTGDFTDATANFGSGADFTSELGSTDTFEARIYAYDFVTEGVNTSLNGRIGLDNIRFSGSKVPEPSTGLIALLGLGMLAKRRR